MNLRPTSETDLAIIANWFIDQPWNLPPVEGGMSRYGYIAFDDDSDIACLSVYMTGTGYAYVDWLGMNPERTFEDHREAIDFLLKRIEELMMALPEPKVHCLVLYTKLNWLSDNLKKIMWRKTTNYIQCTKIIRHEEK